MRSADDWFDSVFAAFERLVAEKPVETRSELEAICVKAGRAGFNAVPAGQSQGWSSTTEELLRGYFRAQLTDEVLDMNGQVPQRWALFASFAVGWLLGLQTTNELPEMEIEKAFAMLPAYMWMHHDRLCGHVT